MRLAPLRRQGEQLAPRTQRYLITVIPLPLLAPRQ